MEKTQKFSTWKTIKLLFSFTKVFKKTIFLASIFSFINTIAYIVGSLLIGSIITIFFEPLKTTSITQFQSTKFFIYLSILLLCFIVYGIFRYLEVRLFVKVSFGTADNIRKELVAKILRLRISFYDKNKAGDIISTLMLDVTNIALSLNLVLSSIVNALINIFISIIIMFLVSTKLTLIVIPISLIMFIAIIILIKKSQPYFIYVQNAFGRLNAFIEESLSNTKVTNAFEQQDKMLEDLKIITKQIRNTAFKSDLITKSFDTIFSVMSNIIILIITAIAALFYLQNQTTWGITNILGASTNIFTPGVIIAYIALNWNFLGPFQNALGVIFNAQVGVASTTRVAKILNEVEPVIPDQHIKIARVIYDEKLNYFKETKENNPLSFFVWKYFDLETKKYKFKSIKGNIEFKNVYFKYNEKSHKYQLNNASFSVFQGQKIAIVGPTGAGKTTIVNLITKYYQYNKGSIKIDGFELNEIDTNCLRDIMTIVLQDSFLFNDTIIDNLKMSNPDATFNQIEYAAQLTKAHDFILGMEKSYQTMIENNGSNLSQGEKQLLSLTRAILSNRNILILDEATSNIDSSTERIVQKAMLHLMEYKTAFIIAHRLSTIKNADLIIVVNDGKIIEQGTHNSLLEQKGFYYNLYKSQFEKI
ncbi:ABC transporter ATP-binding protein [Mycoplasmopsis cynos]|uniref:ABC transporter ATP-binding protein n=1 Tax=Mycoplasmopsis cynos TaxID=171284 RepID=UPI0030CC289B